ncbi:hypothetical protein, partial [Brevibacillus sp. 179-C8.2 HS]|uniref:hypothetical protein n=1 Tax=unclassified Brevibacillus TaxID=2684853 RepID=UPI0039A075D4
METFTGIFNLLSHPILSAILVPLCLTVGIFTVRKSNRVHNPKRSLFIFFCGSLNIMISAVILFNLIKVEAETFKGIFNLLSHPILSAILVPLCLTVGIFTVRKSNRVHNP